MVSDIFTEGCADRGEIAKAPVPPPPGALADRAFAGFPAHDAYVAGLKGRHGRKAAFWELVS